MDLKNFLDRYLTMVRRFIPEPPAQFTIGLDIATNQCKMVQLKKAVSSTELVSWAIEPVRNNDVKQAIRQVLAKVVGPAANVLTAVYGKGTLVRYLDMPRMNPDDLKRSFGFEVDKYFPFPRDQIHTDCFILTAKEKENKMLVLAAAAKKELISQRIELLKGLGLDADFVTLNSMSLANLFNFSNKKAVTPSAPGAGKPGAVAILDIGERVSNLTIMLHGEPRFTRDIFIGGNEFTVCVGNALGLDFAAAEALKCSPQQKTEEVLRACESMILNLVSEIRLSFDYFVTEKNVTIPDLILTGGGALVEGLPETFAKYLEMNVSRLDPLQQITLAGNILADDVKKQICCLAVSLGLALSDG